MRTRFLFPAITLILLPTLVLGQDRKPLSPPEAKAAFLKLLDRPKVEPDVRAATSETRGGLNYESFTFASEKKADGTIERVPVLLVRPTSKLSGPLPAVIVLHGTGGTKDKMQSWLEDFARKGIVGIAIDARYHGDRSSGAKGSAAYVAAITKAWKTPAGQPMEHPFYYDTCWDLWRLIDLLQTKPGIDGSRIGMVGTSMGGIQTWLAASVDDRVKVACPLIGVQSFRWSLENDKWQGRAKTIQGTHDAAAKDLGEPAVNRRVCREVWSKVIPGMLDDFDCPNMIRLFAGRPLYIANGELDPNCPLEGAKLAFLAAEDSFATAGAKDKLVIDVAKGVPHKVTDEQRKRAIDFCAKWLAK